MTTDKKLKPILAKIEKSKAIIAKERDKLRDIHLELGDLLDDLDSGIEDIENGKREIESGIDRLSGYL